MISLWLLYIDIHKNFLLIKIIWTGFQISSLRPQGAKVTSKRPNFTNNVQQKSPIKTESSLLVRDQTNKIGASRSNQAIGGYDAKLVEMINTVIVDRSPSVKWDDVGKQMVFTYSMMP